eukprot:m.173490 g.173490  ORF g.173490 m.173490 type:complete len:558 (+) comp24323_c0_seq1:161-1834(+)
MVGLALCLALSLAAVPSLGSPAIYPVQQWTSAQVRAFLQSHRFSEEQIASLEAPLSAVPAAPLAAQGPEHARTPLPLDPERARTPHRNGELPETGLDGGRLVGLDHAALESLGWRSKLLRTRLLGEISAAMSSIPATPACTTGATGIPTDSAATQMTDGSATGTMHLKKSSARVDKPEPTRSGVVDDVAAPDPTASTTVTPAAMQQRAPIAEPVSANEPADRSAGDAHGGTGSDPMSSSKSTSESFSDGGSAAYGGATDGACVSSPPPSAAAEPLATDSRTGKGTRGGAPDMANIGTALTLCHIAIITAPRHSDQRAAVRATWVTDVRYNPDVTYAFYIASSKWDVAVLKENAIHADIVLLAEIVDSYANLSLKVPAAIRHGTKAYAPAFVAKIDDDTFVNVPGLLAMLRRAPQQRAYLGTRWSGNRPQRSKQSKHYVPESVWPLAALPPYCEGGAYVLSQDLAQYLVVAEHWLRPVGGLEDITMAVWMLSLQVHPQHSPLFLSHNMITQGGNDVVPAARRKHCKSTLITMPDVPSAMLRKMYEYHRAGQSVCKALT